MSGNVIVEECLLVDNAALIGPGIYNSVSVTIVKTDVCDNTLLCDHGSFLDWNSVSGTLLN